MLKVAPKRGPWTEGRGQEERFSDEAHDMGYLFTIYCLTKISTEPVLNFHAYFIRLPSPLLFSICPYKIFWSWTGKRIRKVFKFKSMRL